VGSSAVGAEDPNTPASLDGKRFVGKLEQANNTHNYRLWVRITAEDGATQNIYRYTLYWGSSNANYSTLTGLTIAGNAVALGGDSGWWNHTAAPDLVAKEVTLSSGTNVEIKSTWKMGTQVPQYHWVVITGNKTTPIKEGDVNPVPTFTSVTATESGTASTTNPFNATIPSVSDGDYIVLRAYYPTSSIPIFGHVLIKVRIQQ